MKAGFAIALLAVAMICISVLAQENTAGYWVEKGDELVDNGSYEEALIKYNKAIQIDPENIDTWDRKALVLYILEQQAYRNVLSLSEKRLEKNPKDAGAWQARAVAQSSLGDEDEADSSRKIALEIYDKEIQENPGNATAWFYKAELTTNSTEALAAYEKVIEMNGSKKIASLITKSNILLNLGKSDEATLAIDKAIRLSQNSSEVLIQKALNSYALGKYSESLDAYEKIIEQKPKTAWLWKGKGDAWLGKAESLASPERAEEASSAYNESLQAYEKAIQIDSELARAWMGKGDALMSLKKYNESMRSYENVTEILSRELVKNQNDADAWWLKAESLDNLRRSEAALEAYDKVIDLNCSKAFGARIRKSDIFISLAKYNESLEAFDGALNQLSTQDKKSIMGLWWDKGTTFYHNAWIADGQILRVTSAWYNRSSGEFENIMVVNSDSVAVWQRPTRGKAVSSDGKSIGRHDEALVASSTNWAHYAFTKDEEVA